MTVAVTDAQKQRLAALAPSEATVLVDAVEGIPEGGWVEQDIYGNWCISNGVDFKITLTNPPCGKVGGELEEIMPSGLRRSFRIESVEIEEEVYRHVDEGTGDHMGDEPVPVWLTTVRRTA